LHVADASGAHTLHARDALRAAGYQSELFVDLVDAPLAHEVRSFDELDAFVAPDATAIVYQLAVGSRLVDPLIARKEPLIVNYHNLTPASFFWKWAPDWLDAVALGRSQLHSLAKRTSHAIAVSRFNEHDLRGAGYLSTSVVPPFVDVAASRPALPGIRASGVGGSERPTTWLFVGKLLPHKAAHDLVRALAAYRRAYDPRARRLARAGRRGGDHRCD
jgi:glycosyltransferase involved in cell wall biosynthesis